MVGEGVEHEHQREALHKLGVAQVQGWLFSAAVPASVFADMLCTSPSGCDSVHLQFADRGEVELGRT